MRYLLIALVCLCACDGVGMNDAINIRACAGVCNQQGQHMKSYSAVQGCICEPIPKQCVSHDQP